MKYRKKPVVIDAVKYDGNNLENIVTVFPEFKFTVEAGESKGLGIYTLEGKMICSIGDYLIKGIQGEFYPCKPDIFEASYDEVKEKPVPRCKSCGGDYPGSCYECD